MNHDVLKLIVGVTATLGLYSVLYRENKFYRLVEHVYIGLAVGFSVVALWTETLETSWWNVMVGRAASGDQPAVPGYYLFGLLLPVGLMGYLVFSKKHNWMSRIPIGIILGFWGGQQLQVWWQTYSPQIMGAMRPILPTATNSAVVPSSISLSEQATNQIATATNVPPTLVTQLSQDFTLPWSELNRVAEANNVTTPQIQSVISQLNARVGGEVYMSQAINNIIFLVTLLSILTYFLFSFEQKGKFLPNFTRLGRWLLMVGFGAIFGSTVMTRFALLIDRMYYVLIEFMVEGLPRLFGGGGPA